ncbi:hypothetical protein TREES_T100000976 [Tupaia chinensis]|uniref:Uncharacterized protein n=1 Tax=Tupaia chinensis TaxID=246437 RepID=L9JC35_TUPCH|nr:hypothetical protein TREES_T100000976 [Tupaia chinensis]
MLGAVGLELFAREVSGKCSASFQCGLQTRLRAAAVRLPLSSRLAKGASPGRGRGAQPDPLDRAHPPWDPQFALFLPSPKAQVTSRPWHRPRWLGGGSEAGSRLPLALAPWRQGNKSFRLKATRASSRELHHEVAGNAADCTDNKPGQKKGKGPWSGPREGGCGSGTQATMAKGLLPLWRAKDVFPVIAIRSKALPPSLSP